MVGPTARDDRSTGQRGEEVGGPSTSDDVGEREWITRNRRNTHCPRRRGFGAKLPVRSEVLDDTTWVFRPDLSVPFRTTEVLIRVHGATLLERLRHCARCLNVRVIVGEAAGEANGISIHRTSF